MPKQDSNPVELSVVRGQKRKPCQYCGDDEHEARYACPRIRRLTETSEDFQIDIYFRSDYFDIEIDLDGDEEDDEEESDDEPDDAA